MGGVMALLDRHVEAWRAATAHPFLDGVRDGTLPDAAFDRWLVQDHHFVVSLLRAQAGILAAAPRRDQRVLVGGLTALVDELDWFEGIAARRALALDAAPLPAAQRYDAFLMGLPNRPYAVAVTALWAVERAYLDAWQGAGTGTGTGPGSARFREFVEHWTVPGFAAYVAGLEAAADQVWEHERDAAEAAVLEVAHHEAAFWQMAFEG